MFAHFCLKEQFHGNCKVVISQANKVKFGFNCYSHSQSSLQILFKILKDDGDID